MSVASESMVPNAPVVEVDVNVKCDDAAVLDVGAIAMPGAGSGSKTAAGANRRA